MTHRDFIYLSVPSLLKNATRILPPNPEAIKRAVAIAATHTRTEIEFLRKEGFIRPDAAASSSPIHETVLRLSDLTGEGQDFIMFGATNGWLGACDRKSNDMLKRGASEEDRLAIYADPSGLYRRLEKFRKERLAKSN